MKLHLKKWIENVMRCSFMWRGIASGNLNNYTSTGIYYVNSDTTSGKPVANATNMWGYLFVVGFSSFFRLQLLWATSDSFYIRNYSGSPGAWQQWICMTRSNNNVLWTGPVMFMSETQTVTLSEPVSRQASGIVLCWSAYANGTTYNYDWVYTFVPKWHVKTYSNAGVHCSMGTPSNKTFGNKYVYITDTQIKGHTMNDEPAVTIANGFTRDNHYWVLRAVLGV